MKGSAKKYAGKTVLVERVEAEAWLIKTAQIIPDNERWMHEEPAKSHIDRSIGWAGKNRPVKTDLEKLSAKIAKNRWGALKI